MAQLFGLLNLGAGAYSAQNTGVAVAGRNIANVATEGYSRQRVDMRSELSAPMVGGVRSEGPMRYESDLLAARQRNATSAEGRSGSLSQALFDLESMTATENTNYVEAIAQLFGGILDLASIPTDSAARRQVVSAGEGVAAAFARSADAIATSRSSADARVGSIAAQASQLAAQIAESNRQFAITSDPVIADQRDLAAKKLTSLVGGEARIDADGKMRFTIGGGTVVVDGDRAAAFSTTVDAAYGGLRRIDIVDGAHVQDVTTMISGGQMGGEIAFRDGAAARAAVDLDQLAYDFARSFNAVHRAHAGLDGVAGRDFFVEPASPTGAAANLTVDAALVADTSLLASAAVGGGAADNAGVLALSDVKDLPLAGGATRTVIDEGIRILSSVGSAASTAAQAHELDRSRVDLAAGLRDSLAGVSIEEEMIQLSAYQRASEAAIRFVSTVDELLQNLIRDL